MRAVPFIIFALLINSVELKESNFGYHEKVGIAQAQSILRYEGLSALRIVGGAQTQQFALPYQAGLVVTLSTGWTSVCGGTLISNTRVLTAAHCWWDGQNQARRFTVVLGSLLLFSGGTRLDSTDVVVHSMWNPQDITYDIAMVKIADVEYNNNIQAVAVPTMADVNQLFSGVTAIASGYGKTSDAQNSFPATTSLHQVNLQVITNAVCQQSFEVSIHGSHLCTSGASGVGTCDGDSGGPLTAVWNNQRTLIGIVSFGLGERCQSSYPSVFTRVTTFLTWIQGNM